MQRICKSSAMLMIALLAFPLLARAQAPAADTILPAAAAAKVLPDAVFYAGQSANTQLRNATGIHFADKSYTLAVLVDTSGYTSAVQQKYQGYLITEVPLDFAGQNLNPGAYGFGFVKNQFLVMDIGNHDLLQTATMHDAGMRRPMPLQVLAAGSDGSWKLCAGRDCVSFHRAQ